MIVERDQWVIYSIGGNGSNLIMDRFRIHAFELHHINYAGERDPYVRRPNVPHQSDADYRLIWNHIDDIGDPCELNIETPLGKGKVQALSSTQPFKQIHPGLTQKVGSYLSPT